jgi:hypothetical protein
MKREREREREKGKETTNNVMIKFLQRDITDLATNDENTLLASGSNDNIVNTNSQDHLSFCIEQMK